MKKPDRIKRLIDLALSKIGLVRASKHQSIVDSYKAYTFRLGEAAKEAGVKVLFDEERLIGVYIDSDLFVLGSGNYIAECQFSGSKLIIGPQCQFNVLNGNSFLSADDQVTVTIAREVEV